MKFFATTLCTLMVFAFSAPIAYSYDYLYLQDPRNTWRWGQGTIEEAVLSVHPKGLFMEHGLYLTFSPRGNSFTEYDSLEIQFHFELPPEAIVTDLWLWVGNDIVKATIMDSWRASSIYEGIVKRRRDPAILFKRDGGQYELRVYPMTANQTRRIKLTYLSPARWTRASVSSSLPVNLLKTSLLPLSTLKLLVWQDDTWRSPRVPEISSLQFTAEVDSEFTNLMRADAPLTLSTNSLTLAFNSPMKDGVFLSARSIGEEGWYQLALLPSASLNSVPGKKLAVLVDFDAAKCTFDQASLLAALRATLIQSCAPTDSFNLILGRLEPRRVSPGWLPADSGTISAAFAGLGSDPLGGYSNLPSLLMSGIDFVNSRGGGGDILLAANSDQVGDNRVANQMLADVLSAMGTPIPVTIADFGNTGYNYYYIGDRYYMGNEYFYINLSRATGGSYSALGYSTTPLTEFFLTAAQSTAGTIDAFDLHTSLQGGFCYGRLTMGGNAQTTRLESPVLQTGRFAGAFPFEIEVSGIYRELPFTRQWTLPPEEIAEADSILPVAWSGMQIAQWEQAQQTNEIAASIVNQSLRDRILSLYTAFLALEPNDTVKACASCLDESRYATDAVTEKREPTSDTLFAAYPNPFNARTIIRGRISAAARGGAVSLKIYNVLGQVIRTFDAANVGTGGEFSVAWDGRNDHGTLTTSGMYIFVAATPTSRQTLKLLMVK